jgi:hypothetical protein
MAKVWIVSEGSSVIEGEPVAEVQFGPAAAKVGLSEEYYLGPYGATLVIDRPGEHVVIEASIDEADILDWRGGFYRVPLSLAEATALLAEVSVSGTDRLQGADGTAQSPEAAEETEPAALVPVAGEPSNAPVLARRAAARPAPARRPPGAAARGRAAPTRPAPSRRKPAPKPARKAVAKVAPSRGKTAKRRPKQAAPKGRGRAAARGSASARSAVTRSVGGRSTASRAAANRSAAKGRKTAATKAAAVRKAAPKKSSRAKAAQAAPARR